MGGILLTAPAPLVLGIWGLGTGLVNTPANSYKPLSFLGNESRDFEVGVISFRDDGPSS